MINYPPNAIPLNDAQSFINCGPNPYSGLPPRITNPAEILESVVRITADDLSRGNAGFTHEKAEDARALVAEAARHGWKPFFYSWPDSVCGFVDVEIPEDKLVHFYNRWRSFAELDSMIPAGAA